MAEAELVYEFDFEDESKRDDFGLMCSACKAGTYCNDREQANYQVSITYYCYSCGIRFSNGGLKLGKK